MDRLWRSNSSISSRTGCPLGIVDVEDHKVESCGTTISMCLHNMKSKILKNNTLSMTDTSLNDHACFNYHSNASCLYENFEVDLVPLYDEFMLSKNRIKRKYFQNNFAQSDKNHVKSKWLEKMKQLRSEERL